MTRAADPPGLHEFFDRVLARTPDAQALDVPPGRNRPRRTWTYRELDAAARAAERRLLPWARPEAIVALFAERSHPGLFAAELAVLRRGCAYTYLDPSLPDERARFVLQDAGAVACFVDAERRERLATLAGDLPALVLPNEPEEPEGLTLAPVPADPRRLAYVVYTSGTTGLPKGVELEHGGIANLVASDRDHFALGPGDRVGQGSSHAYDSSVEETWLAWTCGATVVVLDDEAVRLGPDLPAFLRAERITALCPPPTLLRAMGCAEPARELPDLRLLYVGGEPLSRDLADRWAGVVHLENGYGPTECSVTVLRARLHPGNPVTIGHAVSGNRAHVVDDALRPVADGEPGELLISGIALARGYRGRPELTRERFVEHAAFGRCYRTGDVVRRLPSGDHEYLGRRDAQVKLRGYRIELEEIERCLVQLHGIRAAACAVQDETLVAGLVAANGGRPDLDAVRHALAQTLPSYMVPAHFHWIATLPTTVSGKLDRRALPRIAPLPQPAPDAPASPADVSTAAWIAAAWRATLRLAADPGPDDDFFDLGGTSLHAAELVSTLRTDPRTRVLTVRDVYEGRTPRGLLARCAADEDRGKEPASEEPHELPPLWLGAALQTAALVLGILAGAALAYALGFLVLPFLVEGLGLFALMWLSPLLAAGGFLLYAPASLGLAVFAKHALIGRYHAGPVRAWSPGFVRHWLVLRAVRLVPWGSFEHTAFLPWALRKLGARVGENVVVHRGARVFDGGWDLLTIEDGVTLGRDAALRLASLDRGHVVFAPITLRAGVVLETRAGVSGGAELPEGTCVAALSSVEPGTVCAPRQRLDGVPAVAIGPAREEPAIDGDARALSEWTFAWAALGLRGALRFAAALPALVLLTVLVQTFALDEATFLRFLYDPLVRPEWILALAALSVVALPLGLALQACLLRVLPRAPAGVHHRRSRTALLALVRMRAVESAGTWLSGALFWPRWLRLAGMRVGAGCEISSIMDVLPEHVEVGAESFFADGIYLGGPRFHGTTIAIGDTRLGRRTFLGNHVVIPGGAQLPDDVLLGVCTPAEPGRIRVGSSWFGHPPLELPRREVVTLDRALTHEPTAWRVAVRVSWETARFALPVLPVVLLLAWFGATTALLGSGAGFGSTLLAATASTLAVGAAFLLVVLWLKWTLLGRVRPGRHGLWSSWCSRWDFLYVAWNRFARRPLLALEGTPWLAWYLRAMGMSIGRRVLLGGGFAQVVDPDMLHVEDGATFDPLLQAHSFEDRVLKIERVHVRAHATVADQALLLYGADVGRGARVAAQSVVLKHETLLPGRSYAGVPTREVSPRALPQAPTTGMPTRAKAERHDAVDAARGLAVLIMIYMHLVPAGALGGLGTWLAGKGAVLFVLLAGFVWSEQAARTPTGPRYTAYVLRRAAALFAFGWLLAATVWPTEILRTIAVLFLISSALVRLPNAVLADVFALVLLAAPVLAIEVAEWHAEDWHADGRHVFESEGSVSATVRALFLTGNYPIVTWIAFPLAGAWLARFLVGSADERRRRARTLLFAALPLFLACQAFAGWATDREELLGYWASVFQSTWTPTSVAFVLVTTTFGAALLAFLFAVRWRALERVLVPIGRASLTHYVLHVLVVFVPLRAAFPDEDWSTSLGLATFGAYALFALWATPPWFRAFRRGPLETLLARLAGRPR